MSLATLAVARLIHRPCPKKTIYNPLLIWYHLTCSGDVAQLGERDNRTVEVRGSSPLISTRTLCSEPAHHLFHALQIANQCGIVNTTSHARSHSSRAMNRSSRSTSFRE